MFLTHVEIVVCNLLAPQISYGCLLVLQFQPHSQELTYKELKINFRYIMNLSYFVLIYIMVYILQ